MSLSIQSKPIQAKVQQGLFLTLIVKLTHDIAYSVASRVSFTSYRDGINTKLTVFDDKLVIKRSGNVASLLIEGNN